MAESTRPLRHFRAGIRRCFLNCCHEASQHPLGEPCLGFTFRHTISDDVRIPERIEIGAEPGITFELAGPREKLFSIRSKRGPAS